MQMLSQYRFNRLPTFAIIGCLFPLAGCDTEVTVDGADQELEDGCSSCEQSLPPYVGDGECAAEDELARATYETWARTPNEFGSLPPGTWEGSIHAKPATLTIAADFSAQLTIGDPVSLDPEVGPFCEGLSVPYDCGALFSPGGSYPIHGAKLVSGQLTFPLWRASVYDDWCRLQEPTNEDVDLVCHYQAERNAVLEITSVGGDCLLDNEEPIDCARLYLTLYDPVCRCASDGCFPQLEKLDQVQTDNSWGPPSEEPLVVLEVSDGGQSLEGEGPDGKNIELTRVD